MLVKVAEHIMCQLSLPTGVDTKPISTVGLLRSSAELRHQAPKKKIIVVCYTATGEAECPGKVNDFGQGSEKVYKNDVHVGSRYYNVLY